VAKAARALVGVDEGEDVGPDERGLVVTKQSLHGGALVADRTVGIDDGDDIGGVLDEGAEAFLLAQLFSQLRALRSSDGKQTLEPHTEDSGEHGHDGDAYKVRLPHGQARQEDLCERFVSGETEGDAQNVESPSLLVQLSGWDRLVADRP